MSRDVDGDVLLLDLPAAPGFLPVLRTATAGLATRLSFGLDAIEDLRLAVDEAAGLMMAAVDDADSSATLHCRFDVTESELLISIGAAGIGTLPPRQSFDWRVLDALTGSVNTELHNGVTTVRLAQPRPRVS